MRGCIRIQEGYRIFFCLIPYFGMRYIYDLGLLYLMVSVIVLVANIRWLLRATMSWHVWIKDTNNSCPQRSTIVSSEWLVPQE